MPGPPKHLLSKSTFMYGVQCPKRLWLYKNLPKERDLPSTFQRAIFQQGTHVGELARKLFPGGIDASPENSYSYQRSIIDTLRYIHKGHQVIYEAAFQFEGILCAIDILVNINHKWHAFEVKSTTRVKEAHILDAALQYYVISGAGIDLEDISIIHLNRNYIRQGGLNIQHLFGTVSILKEVMPLQADIYSKVSELSDVLAGNIPPDIKVGPQCNMPYTCDFQQFCNEGAMPSNNLLRDKDKVGQIICSLKDHLARSYYCLHLDAWNNSIPMVDGHWPYKQVCFQFALSKSGNGEVIGERHYFLTDGYNDQRKLVENLLNDVQEEGIVFVHHQSFSHYLIGQYAAEFTDLAPALRALQSRLYELPDPLCKDFVLQKSDTAKFGERSPDDHTQKPASGFYIQDQRSASAAFFNVTFGFSEQPIDLVKESLKNYAENSSGEMLRLLAQE